MLSQTMMMMKRPPHRPIGAKVDSDPRQEQNVDASQKPSVSETSQPNAADSSHSANPGMIPIRTGYFNASDGTRLFYSTEGRGHPLVFVYGLVCSSLHWTYQIDHFRKGYQTVWFDYRGHNHSEIPKDLSTLTVDQMSDDLNDLLKNLQLKKAIFLGHSMGVNVLLDFARKFPKKVHGLVLANGTPRRPFETIFNTNLTELAFSGFEKAMNTLPKVVSTLWKAQKSSFLLKRLVGLGGFNIHLSSPKDVDLYVEKVADMDPRVFVQLVKNYRDYDATAWLDQIHAPSLILSGAEDLITPPAQQALMHQLLPKSQLERIPHGSHCSQMDLPELINFKLQSFFDRLNWRFSDISAEPTVATPSKNSQSKDGDA